MQKEYKLEGLRSVQMSMDIKIISEKISYIAACDNPLSADIGIIKSGDTFWLFDVGNGENRTPELDNRYRVVLSHFHQDHIGNINKIQSEEVYVSKTTYEHVHKGTVVTEDLYIGGLHIFPLPSSHAPGCLGLEVDNTYVFVGDALYSRIKDDNYVYNVQLLKDEIEVIKKLKAPFILVSHYAGMIRNREDVIEELETIYSMRNRNSSEILVPMKRG